MEERFERTLEIFIMLGFAFIVIMAGFFISQFIEMLNDYRCTQLPPQEFFNDPKCERYRDFYERQYN